jgi:hypothetical protein
MQPYFVPYAGYFRLFACADVVVMLDSVQFPRRGWVHRNRFELAGGELDWLTLPLAKPAYDARIDELQFSGDVHQRLERALPRFPLLARAAADHHPLLARCLRLGDGTVADYLVDLVRDITRELGFSPQIVRSSELEIDPELHGQERIIAIAQRMGAARYVNPSGGRDLYDSQAFSGAGMELGFLTPYGGSMASVLTRLLSEPAAAIAEEIVRESRVEP